MPWAGGLNAAHYNTMDLNHDGKDDLVLFDRTADKVITFLQQNNQYQYAPDYESFFPGRGDQLVTPYGISTAMVKRIFSRATISASKCI